MCLLTYNYVCVHACECYVCLSVHIHTYNILCCVLGCMLTEHVPMSTYCTAQRQLDICTQSIGRGPECDISHVYACVCRLGFCP